MGARMPCSSSPQRRPAGAAARWQQRRVRQRRPARLGLAAGAGGEHEAGQVAGSAARRRPAAAQRLAPAGGELLVRQGEQLQGGAGGRRALGGHMTACAWEAPRAVSSSYVSANSCTNTTVGGGASAQTRGMRGGTTGASRKGCRRAGGRAGRLEAPGGGLAPPPGAARRPTAPPPGGRRPGVWGGGSSGIEGCSKWGAGSEVAGVLS